MFCGESGYESLPDPKYGGSLMANVAHTKESIAPAARARAAMLGATLTARALDGGLLGGLIGGSLIFHSLIEKVPDLLTYALVVEEDIVACRILSEGTNLGSFDGVLPPTGKRFAAYQSHWFRVAGNKLMEHWATREDLAMLLQLGIIQLPGRRPE
jgi:SnoaL-like polyketide cyclase